MNWTTIATVSSIPRNSSVLRQETKGVAAPLPTHRRQVIASRAIASRAIASRAKRSGPKAANRRRSKRWDVTREQGQSPANYVDGTFVLRTAYPVPLYPVLPYVRTVYSSPQRR